MIKLQVIGNLGKDCITNTVNGKNVINFNVAHTEKFKDAQGNQKDKTIWVECAYWTDRTGIAPYLKKGRIPAKAYGLPADVPSFGVNAILMTTADMDPRAVTDFALSLGTEIKELQDKSPVLENLTAQDIVTEALPAPLHPAALEVYRKLELLK